MRKKYVLPILAGIGLILGIVAVIITRRDPPTPPIPFAPSTPPFTHFVAGEGVLEAESEDISIGTPYTQIVDEVFVVSGDQVTQGGPLFKLNTDVFEAELAEAQAALAVAQASYQKQLDLPRDVDVPPYRSRIQQAESDFMNMWKQYELVDKLENPKAVSRDEYNKRKYSALSAKYKVQEMEEELARIEAGSWVRDLEISREEIRQAQKKVETLAVEIERSTVKAPLDGFVFRVNIRKGETAQVGETQNPLVLFGSIDPMHIRVDIDEADAWRVIPGAPGKAFMRGNSNLNSPLTFVRLEPYLVPKQALTGDTGEKVDTRVLQLIYKLDNPDLPIFPGMLMDVYLESKSFEGAM